MTDRKQIEELTLNVENIIYQVSLINNHLYELKRKLYYINNPCTHNWVIDYTIQCERTMHICTICSESK